MNDETGVPGGTRTPNLLLRRQLLYPAELQAHIRFAGAAAAQLLKTFAAPHRPVFGLERVMGIEPTFSAWKADILPLNYTRASRARAAFCQLSNSSTEAEGLSRAFLKITEKSV